MNKFRIIVATLALAVTVVAQTEKPRSIWAMPNIWPRHRQLRKELMAAIHRGDIPAMESTCRAAILIMPDDATWHYNLACALAYREDPAEALDELEKAINFGFRQADAIAADKDFARIKENPRFQTLVEKAREYLTDYWGGMVRKGADTFWEAYDPSNDYLSPYDFFPVNSACHAWSCTPVYFMQKYPEVFK